MHSYAWCVGVPLWSLHVQSAISSSFIKQRCEWCRQKKKKGEARGRQKQQGQSSRRPPPLQRSFATVVAGESAKLHAQLGQPASEAEREKLRTLLTNMDASIAALAPVATGDEHVHQILTAQQEKRKQVQARLSALRPLKTKAQSGP